MSIWILNISLLVLNLLAKKPFFGGYLEFSLKKPEVGFSNLYISLIPTIELENLTLEILKISLILKLLANIGFGGYFEIS